MADEKDWRIKYFNSLKQLDDMETTWYKLESLLRKAISRLAITAKGLNPKLDQLLQKIQVHSRDKDDEALEQDLQQLSILLSEIDESLPEVAPPAAIAVNEGSSIHPFLLQLIDQLRVDTDHSARIQGFKDAMQGMDSQQCLQGLSDIINKLHQHEPEDKVSAQQLLITLIEKITLTHGNSEQFNALQDKLAADFDMNDWGLYLDEIIAEIQNIIGGISNEKAELEGLIVDVTRQLNEISEVLTDEQADSIEGRKDTHQLQKVMTESVESIQAQVEQESDIGRLKSSINQHLVLIKNGVKVFIEKDSKRYDKTESRNQRLKEQLRFMEQESDQLQQKLTENRKKLMFDTLTGVRSRLSYDELLEQEFSRWLRYQETFSFALLDIDLFKRVNDQFGHNAGDKALQVVAKMMMRHIRKTDFLFRIGGEEFVLLLPKTDALNAAPLVEKIRDSVGKSSFHFKQQKVDITLSAGLTEIKAGDSQESVYERADAALYEAKNGGRNRLVIKAD